MVGIKAKRSETPEICESESIEVDVGRDRQQSPVTILDEFIVCLSLKLTLWGFGERFRAEVALDSPFQSCHRSVMNTEVVERNLANLERRVAEIEDRLGEPKPVGWRAVAGQAEDDDLFEEAIRLGAEWRVKANASER